MKKLLVVSKFTILEVYRSRLMVSLLFLAMILLVISYITSEFAYGSPAKVTLDVGVGIMSLSNLIIAILIGSTLLSREIEQRTLYMIISRPISRASFILGKILGLSTVLLINSLVLGVLSFILFKYHGGEVHSLFYWVLLFSFFEAFIVLLFAVLFSLITNITLSVVYSVGVFITGHALNETSKNLFAKISPLFNGILEVSFVILPNLYRLNLKDFLLYRQSVSLSYLSSTLIYTVFYTSALLALIVLIFKNKKLD